MMAWWVSLGTFLYFLLTLLPFKAYFNDKPLAISDGSHPFYLWKLLTFFNDIFTMAGLHLTMLLCCRAENIDKIEVLLYTGPFALLLID